MVPLPGRAGVWRVSGGWRLGFMARKFGAFLQGFSAFVFRLPHLQLIAVDTTTGARHCSW